MGLAALLVACGGQSLTHQRGEGGAAGGGGGLDGRGGKADGGTGGGGGNGGLTDAGGTGGSAATSRAGAAGTGGAGGAVTATGTGGGAAHSGGACNAYDAADLSVACNTLADCEPTLAKYLAKLSAGGGLDGYIARTGCGLVELVPPARTDGPAVLLTFDAAGDLAGYFIQTLGRAPPCDEYKYVRGAQIPSTCETITRCRVVHDATSLSNLCNCPCPDPPPPDGVAVVESACVGPPDTLLGCGSPGGSERRFEPIGVRPLPAPIEDCNGSYIELGALECVYDRSGMFVGERSPDPGSTRCPGVTEWLTEGTPPSCPATP